MFDDYDDLLTVTEAAALLKMSRGNLYPLLATGKLRAYRNGRTWRIPKESIIRFIRESSNLLH